MSLRPFQTPMNAISDIHTDKEKVLRGCYSLINTIFFLPFTSETELDKNHVNFKIYDLSNSYLLLILRPKIQITEFRLFEIMKDLQKP